MEEEKKNGYKLIEWFKAFSFNIEVKINVKVAEYLDAKFKIRNKIVSPYGKLNSTLLNVNKRSNHPQQILQGTEFRLSGNSSNTEIFNELKENYDKALNKRQNQLEF